MENRKGTFIYSTLRTISSGDTYPITISNENKGGLHSYQTISDMFNIPLERRVEGMEVYISSGTTKYILSGGTDNSNFIKKPNNFRNGLSGYTLYNGIDSNGNGIIKSIIPGLGMMITDNGESLTFNITAVPSDNINNTAYNYSIWSGDTVSGATRQALANKFNSINNDFITLSGKTDLHVTGVTFNNSNYLLDINLNNGTIFTTNLSILSSDVTITGGTYDINTGSITFINNTGGTFSVSGFITGITNTYTTGATLSNNIVTFTRNDGNTYNLDLSSLSGNTTPTYLSNNNYDYSSWSGDTVSGATRQSLANKFNSIDNNFNNYLPLSGYTSGGTPSLQTIYLSGDVIGSGTTAITTSVNWSNGYSTYDTRYIQTSVFNSYTASTSGGSYVDLTTNQYDISGIKSFINLSGNTISGNTYYLTNSTGNTKTFATSPSDDILRIGEDFSQIQFRNFQILDTNDGLYKNALQGGFNNISIGNGYGSLSTPSTIRGTSGSVNINSNTAGNTVSLSTLGSTNTNNGIRLFTGQWNNTSGTALLSTIVGGFNVNSGVGNYTMLSLYSPIAGNNINQRNSATGTITCLDVNPTVINVASGGTLYGIRSRINNISSGNTFNIYADGTAPNYFGGSIGIGTIIPDSQSILDIVSTTKGFTIPSLTSAAIASLTTIRDGALVYQNDGTKSIKAKIDGIFTTLGGTTDYICSFSKNGPLTYSLIPPVGGGTGFTTNMGCIIPKSVSLQDICVILGTSSAIANESLNFIVKKLSPGIGNTGLGSSISLGGGTTVATLSMVSGGALGVAYYRNAVLLNQNISVSAGDLVWVETNNFAFWSADDVQFHLRFS